MEQPLELLSGLFFFFVAQLPLLRGTGFRFQFTLHRDQAVRKLAALMLPRSLTLLIAQIAITANVFFASFTTSRGLVILELAQTLMLAPVLLLDQ